VHSECVQTDLLTASLQLQCHWKMVAQIMAIIISFSGNGWKRRNNLTSPPLDSKGWGKPAKNEPPYDRSGRQLKGGLPG
jgi:hypothetical protein